MLQFITSKNERYSTIEQVKMALEAGCKWIELNIEGATNDEAKATIDEVIPLCKDADAILVIDDFVELAKELEVTGVRLCKKEIKASDARNMLEGGPIIGINVSTAGDIYALKGIDVDYVALGAYETLGLESYQKIVSEVRENGVMLPIVAYGDITLEDIEDIMATGVNGVAMGKAVVEAENPIEYIKAILNKLYK